MDYYDASSTSNCSKISARAMENILDRLKNCSRRDSTMKNYTSVWKKFNNFIIALDVKPRIWEDRMSLFGAFLFNNGMQSSTLRSYFLAITSILKDDGYTVNYEKLLLSSLVRSCKMINDKASAKLPIQLPLLEILLFEFGQKFAQQPYLEKLYKALFLLAYYGMFRISELTSGLHPVRAKDVHIAQNKQKLLFMLYSSKNHDAASRPQRVKITANANSHKAGKIFFCPFRASWEFLAV